MGTDCAEEMNAPQRRHEAGHEQRQTLRAILSHEARRFRRPSSAHDPRVEATSKNGSVRWAGAGRCGLQRWRLEVVLHHDLQEPTRQRSGFDRTSSDSQIKHITICQHAAHSMFFLAIGRSRHCSQAANRLHQRHSPQRGSFLRRSCAAGSFLNWHGAKEAA